MDLKADDGFVFRKKGWGENGGAGHALSLAIAAWKIVSAPEAAAHRTPFRQLSCTAVSLAPPPGLMEVPALRECISQASAAP